MVNDFINLKALNLDELVGVVSLYPWFGGARKELCLRMSRYGSDKWSDREWSEAALYVASRRLISDIYRASREAEDCSDRNIGTLLETYLGRKAGEEASENPKREVRSGGGDFFSQEEYDAVSGQDEVDYASFAAAPNSKEGRTNDVEQSILTDFCTETLAEIYAEQGYYEQARYIYSKLILRYPEKNAYFAALIEKLEKNQ